MLSLVNTPTPLRPVNNLSFAPTGAVIPAPAFAPVLPAPLAEAEVLPAQAIILPIRPAALPVFTESQPAVLDAPVGVPSCAPLVQHTLLQMVQMHLPATYERATNELGLSLERTQALLKRRIPIVSADRALRLGRLIALEPKSREVFALAGANLCQTMQQEMNRPWRSAVRTLPRQWRVKLMIEMARRIAPRFAGSTNQIFVTPYEHGVYLTLRASVFSDRLETLSGAHAYYRNIFTTLLQEYAHIDCDIVPVRHRRVHLHECNFKVAWDA